MAEIIAELHSRSNTMRAFYDPSQAAHDPSQLLRHGRIVTPNDSPERTARLLGALADLGVRDLGARA